MNIVPSLVLFVRCSGMFALVKIAALPGLLYLRSVGQVLLATLVSQSFSRSISILQ